MKIKRCPVIFHNIISTTMVCKRSEWHRVVQATRNAILLQHLYSTGPVVYQASQSQNQSEEVELTLYMPVNRPVELQENSRFTFQETMHLKDGLVLRHADLDDDIELSYEWLRIGAESNQLKLVEPFYHIYLDVYGEGIIDIFAPIAQEEPDDLFR